MMKYSLIIICSFLFLAAPVDRVAASDKAAAETQRQALQTARETALEQLFGLEPSAKEEIGAATGYAVFPGPEESSMTAAYVSGILHYNHDGKDLYMKMMPSGESGQSYNLVLVFHTAEAINNFKDVGWDFSGQLNSNAEEPLTGVGVSGAQSVMPGTAAYRFNQDGMADQLGLQDTKFMVDESLN